MKKKSMDWYHQEQRFSVRKYHFGAASVLLGTALVFGGAQASADEVTTPATPSTEATAASSETPVTSEEAPAALTASEAPASAETTTLDKGALQVAISQAKALDLSDKTSESVAILLAQIEHVQTVLDTATSQEELDQAVLDLQAAQAQLATKAVEAPKAETAKPVATEATSETAKPAETTTSTVSTESLGKASAASLAESKIAETGRSGFRAMPASAGTSALRAASHTPKEVSSVSTGSFSATSTYYKTSLQSWNIHTKLTEPAKDGDYVEYDYDGIYVAGLNGASVSVNGVKIGTITDTILTDEWAKSFSLDLADRQSAKIGSRTGKIRVTFNKAVEDFSDVNFSFGLNDVELGTAGTPSGWTMTSYIKDRNGVIASGTTNLPGLIVGAPVSPQYYSVPTAAGVSEEGVWSGGVTTSLTSTNSDYLGAGDSVTINLDPSGSIRYNLSSRVLKPGYKLKVSDGYSSVNGNGVYVSSGKEAEWELESVSSTQVTWRLLHASPGFSNFGISEPVLIVTPSAVNVPAKSISGIKITTTVKRSNGAIIGNSVETRNMRIAGTVSSGTAVNAPRGNVYVQYVDEEGKIIPGTSKKAILENVLIDTPYTTVGLDLASFPNYSFVKLQDGSGPISGVSVVNDLTVTYVYHYNTEAERFTPTGQDLTVKHNETPNVEDGIANKGDLPAGTSYAWKGTAPDTSTPGAKPATITVTYPDGSAEDVAITVNVTPQSDEFAPVGKDVPAKHGDTPSAADGIANKGDLPTGTTYAWKGGNPDTSTPGDKPAVVTVTYPDGTSEDVNVTVKVSPQADDYDPKGQDLTVDHGSTPNAEDGIANKGTLPTGTSYAWKGTAPDTTTPGAKPATVVVTYPDGSTAEVPVTVTVKPEADLYEPKGQDVNVKHGETPSAAKGIANRADLPAGTTYDWKTPVDTTTPGDKPATVVVTYPDGTTDEVPVTVKVAPQADDYNPTGQDVSVKNGCGRRYCQPW